MPLGAIGDVFQLVLRQSLFTNEILNVFYYQQLNANNDPDNNSSVSLLGAFVEDVLPEIAPIQITNLNYVGIDVINLFNPDDLFSDDSISPSTGSYVVTSVLPQFMAWEFRTARLTRSIRRGYKRFAGLDEAMVADGGAASGILADLASAATAISANIAYSSAPLAPTFRPVVVKRIKETDAEGNVTYRLPEGNAEAEVMDATFSYLRLSTQNSRKGY